MQKKYDSTIVLSFFYQFTNPERYSQEQKEKRFAEEIKIRIPNLFSDSCFNHWL